MQQYVWKIPEEITPNIELVALPIVQLIYAAISSAIYEALECEAWRPAEVFGRRQSGVKTDLSQRDTSCAKRNVPLVFKMPKDSFDPLKTLGYSIGEVLKNKGMKKNAIKQKVQELLEQCELEPRIANRYPHEVSGGQCQRAAIARALAAEPEILICDEATSALDVTVQRQILKLLMKMKFLHNLSIVLICHDLAMVQLCCDDVLVINNGKMMESGPTDLVIADPQSEYTQNMIRSLL